MRRPRPAPAPERRYTQAEVDARVEQARTSQQVHDVRGTQQTRMTVEGITDKVEARVTAAIPGAVQAAVQAAMPAKSGDVPTWLKISGAVAGLVGTTGATLLLVWNLAITPTNARLAAVETKQTEQMAAVVSLQTELRGAIIGLQARDQALAAEIVELRAQVTTATQIRNQQTQGLGDRVTNLERADQVAADQQRQTANILAGIVPRLDDMLRRLERMEGRMSGQSPMQRQDGEIPTRWLLPVLPDA